MNVARKKQSQNLGSKRQRTASSTCSSSTVMSSTSPRIVAALLMAWGSILSTSSSLAFQLPMIPTRTTTAAAATAVREATTAAPPPHGGWTMFLPSTASTLRIRQSQYGASAAPVVADPSVRPLALSWEHTGGRRKKNGGVLGFTIQSAGDESFALDAHVTSDSSTSFVTVPFSSFAATASASVLRKSSKGVADVLPPLPPYDVGSFFNDDEEDVPSPESDRPKGKTDVSNTIDTDYSSEAPNSLAEWARTVDLSPLLQRRQDIRNRKHSPQESAQQQKKKKQQVVKISQNPSAKKEYLSVLNRIFQQPSSPYSNKEVKQMYQAAKRADQAGDRQVARRILQALVRATPHDARVYRRLSRLEMEDNRPEVARQILRSAVKDGGHGDNALMWHALAGVAESHEEAGRYYRRAMEVEPTVPHPYHAWGTKLHGRGEIAEALAVLKAGIRAATENNHRLHHALGDIYRDAKMLDLAQKSYENSLRLGPPVSRGFAITALAYTAYERGDTKTCRQWLRKAITLNEGRQSNAWVAMAQFEESEGFPERALALCETGITRYEHGLLKQAAKRKRRVYGKDSEPTKYRVELMSAVPSYRSGDRFFNLYRTWTRLEERHGSPQTVDAVFTRALAAFPRQWRVGLDWADFYAARGNVERTRALFTDACHRAGSRSAEPYRLYAQYEHSLGNYTGARTVSFAGAMAVGAPKKDDDSSLVPTRLDLAQLYHTWAMSEWHLGQDLFRAEHLFAAALQCAGDDDEGSVIRSYIYFSLASLEYFRKEYMLSKHCVALCLKESSFPGGTQPVWELWASVAQRLGHHKLHQECRERASAASAAQECFSTDMAHLTRRDPWHHKVFGVGKKKSNFFHAIPFPEMKEDKFGNGKSPVPPRHLEEEERRRSQPIRRQPRSSLMTKTRFDAATERVPTLA